MPDSKQISKETIEQEIYKTFEECKQEKEITIVDYLNRLHLSYFNDEYRTIKFTFESLFKLILFQKLKGIKFHTKLTKYIRQHRKELHALGFSDVPDRRIIGHFIHHILDDETKELIQFAAKKTEEISEKFGILLDIKTFEPEKPGKETKERNQYLQRNEKTKEICRLFKKRFTPFINLNLKNNTIYKKINSSISLSIWE
jgi:hypothetical protein